MFDNSVFRVTCDRIPRRNWYYVKHLVNNQLYDRIMELPKDKRKYNPATLCWEISADALMILIKRYKGSNKIKFDFGNETSRQIFIDLIKKLDEKENEKRKYIESLALKKEEWIAFKKHLEENYEQYIDTVQQYLKPEIKLYPHQITSTMYLNAVRNALLALDMGTGKSLISIAFAEMNPFKKVFVITPNSLKFNYYNEVKKFTNSSAYIIGKKNDCSIDDAKYIIVNYEFFNSAPKTGKVINKMKKLGINKIDCLIVDECFTYDTLVDTNKGKIKIGDIVDNKLDVEVLSYNHQLNAIEYKPILRHLNNDYKNTIRLELLNGIYVECTPEHKFYSVNENKYKQIKDFNTDDKLYYRNDNNVEIISYNDIKISESSNVMVYNLEIADNHNYFANGILVSNCHRLKSTKSNTYINFRKIFKDDIFIDKQPCKIFMSGTPAPSRAAELYNVLNQISPTDFPTKTHFYNYYLGMEYNHDEWGWKPGSESSKFEELFNKISPFTYRKKKSEVLRDLPEKTYQKVMLEMCDDEYNVYYDLEAGVANEFTNKEIHNPLAIMGKLREYTSALKVNSVSELIDSILDANEKFVGISFYKDCLYKLHERYKSISVLHTGDFSDVENNKSVTQFQDENSEIKLFFGSEGTTKEGLTLTAASKIGMLTIPWTPGTLDQCTDRCARIGQKNAVNAYIFIYKDTIDEYIFDLIEAKRSEITQVIDGEKYDSNVNQSIINDLIKKIKDKHAK